MPAKPPQNRARPVRPRTPDTLVRPRRLAPLIIAAVVDIALICAFFWSRGGQVTELRIEARGQSFSTWIDGRASLAATISDAPADGGLYVVIPAANPVPSLPRPRGIDRLVVTDLKSGAVLLKEDFAEDPARTQKWAVNGGRVVLDRGTLSGSGGPVRLEHFEEAWGDYAVDIIVKNASEVQVGVRARAANSAVLFTARPFQNIDSFLGLVQPGLPQAGASKGAIPFKPVGTGRSLVAIFLAPLALIAACLTLMTFLAIVLQFARLPELRLELPRAGLICALLAIAMAAMAFATALYLMLAYAKAMPHVPDELSYLFQAKVFAAGHLSAAPPPSEESFTWSNPAPIVVHDGKWASIYPFGQPLVLAAGALVGAAWVAPPLLGAASVGLVFMLGRRLYRGETALLAALMFAGSPFLLMTSSNFMSHTTSAFFLLSSLVFLAYADRRPLVFAATAGIFLGLVFNTRPLTAVALVPAFGMLLSLGLVPRRGRGLRFRQAAAFSAGGLVMLVLFFAYRYATTGSPFTIEAVQGGTNSLGFSGGHTFAAGLSNEQTQAAYLMLVSHNWPVALGIGLAILPFALGSTRGWDWFLLGCAIGVMAIYTLYFYNGLMHGPRFWFEAFPLIVLLSARGVELGASRADEIARAVASRLTKTALAAPRRSLLRPALYLSVAALAVCGSYDWLRGDGGNWSADFVPHNARSLKAFNGIDERLVRRVEDAHLQDALVLVQDCPNWQCYGNVFWLNSPWLDGPVVYARRQAGHEAETAKTLARFPERVVYEAIYASATLNPIAADGTAIRGGAATRARDIVLALPAPAEVVSTTGAADRDRRRRLDVELLVRYVQEYYARHGQLPAAAQAQTLCAYPADAGCRLKEIGPLPLDPIPGWSYLYWTPGPARFVLIARMETTQDGCSIALPSPLDQLSLLYCVGGEAD